MNCAVRNARRSLQSGLTSAWLRIFGAIFLSIRLATFVALVMTVGMAMGGKMQQVPKTDNHKEAALYWSAVSLMVCEGLLMEQAANRLGVDADLLEDILHRRNAQSPFEDFPDSPLPAWTGCRRATESGFVR